MRLSIALAALAALLPTAALAVTGYPKVNTPEGWFVNTENMVMQASAPDFTAFCSVEHAVNPQFDGLTVAGLLAYGQTPEGRAVLTESIVSAGGQLGFANVTLTWIGWRAFANGEQGMGLEASAYMGQIHMNIFGNIAMAGDTMWMVTCATEDGSRHVKGAEQMMFSFALDY